MGSRRDGPALVEGVYEHLVTDALAGALDRTGLRSLIEPLVLDSADAPAVLARHLGRELERVLASLPRDQLADHARALLEHLAGLARPDASADVLDQRVAPPPRRLLSLHRGEPFERPASSLATSTLLTRNRAEPSFGHELNGELASADRVDAIIAFVTVGGVRRLHEALQRFALRPGARLRILTTVFTGTTEIAALDLLARLPGAEVKVSYDTRRTRLHAKAWLFQRRTGLSTAYVGSANLTSTALGEGHEWMVKLTAADLPDVIGKFAGTFETLWADPEFETFAPDDADQVARLRRALEVQVADPGDTVLIHLEALPHQQEVLDRLAAERALHGRHRNLVVAATGTGKTVIAALDYAREAARHGVPPRLLFLAHRAELLHQARQTFRHALQDASFGELLVGDHQPARWDHVFASIQSAASTGLLARVGADHFRHVVVDECHHVPAASYQALVPRLAPAILVGLTATPERADRRSLLPDFDGHVAAELRLWHALDDQLLVPFEYFGISDDVDLRQVRWTRTGYDDEALSGLYTGHTARADLVATQLRRRVSDVRTVRGLGFCVSVAHAEFMAERFRARGIPALAVHGGSDQREAAPALLRERAVNVLFTCDLYNEGVDLPFVDTLLFLRPTQSATLFLQQLGRGLRHHPARPLRDQPRKTTCLVLDFIGRHRAEFRFDAALGALTGIPRTQLRRAVEADFPYLPSGCALQLDAVAREQILGSLRTTIGGLRRLAGEVRDLARDGAPPTLAGYLDATGRDLDEVYQAGGWTTVRRAAGVLTPSATEPPAQLDELSRRLGWLAHVDEPTRLASYADLLAPVPARPLTDLDRRRLLMLESQLHPRGVLRAAEATQAYFRGWPTIVDELAQLREVLRDRIPVAGDVYPVEGWPLALHRHYSRREVAVAVGYLEAEAKNASIQGGILKLPTERRELLFVTLDKSGKDFSPTTRYRDYAISADRFHWETQAVASVARPSGRRYLDSPGNGWSFYLFVRTDPDADFAFLGPVTYASHEGDRPIAIVWRLASPLPAFLYDRYTTLRPA